MNMTASYPSNTPTSAVVQPQAQIFIQPQQAFNSSKARKLRGIAAVEVVLGSLCIVLGVAGLSIHRNWTFSFFYIYGRSQGLWCGVWAVVAGGLGIAAGRKSASPCIVNCHMGFAITTAVFSAILFGFELGMVSDATLSLAFGLTVVNIAASMVLFILLIASASLTCYVNPHGCCGGGCGQIYSVPNHQVMYIANTTGQPPAYVQNVQPDQQQTGYVVQTVLRGMPQPATPALPPTTTAHLGQAMALDQLDSDAIQQKQQQAFNSMRASAEGNPSHPPPYSI
ncbi:uncharacterized protein LOC143470431 [Clavelina lepadiformis]|uniref:Uncharacterized protein n=1 Tax=Clavelina lepadiformis TaxID=159417 RepID=A0ABP0FKR7_CLALP